MSEWNMCNLKSLTTKIGSGATPRGGGDTYLEEGISLVRSQNIYDMSFSVDGLAHISEEQAYELRNVSLETNDVLLNITGDSVARCCIIPDFILPARVNQHVAIIRADLKKAVPKFIQYSLCLNKENLLMMSEIGATRKALTKGMIEDFEILIPPLPEQQAIAEVLSSIDDKIDLLHRNNKTLEEMAETLFRQWFVEGAKEEWEEKPLKYFGQIICGKTPSTSNKDFFDGSIPFVKIPDMHGNVFIFNTTTTLTESGVNSQPKKTLPVGAIMVSCIATVGLVAISTASCQTNQQINSIVPSESHFTYFLFLSLKNMKDELKTLAGGGSVTDNLNTTDFSNIGINMPNEDILKNFDQLVNPIFEKIKYNAKNIITLGYLRDTLLPKLMSGQVRVGNN
jgi:type I restriction enzyme S subunit